MSEVWCRQGASTLCQEQILAKYPTRLLVFANPTFISWAVWALQLQQRSAAPWRAGTLVCSHRGKGWEAAAFWVTGRKYRVPKPWLSPDKPPSLEHCDRHLFPCIWHQWCLLSTDLQSKVQAKPAAGHGPLTVQNITRQL